MAAAEALLDAGVLVPGTVVEFNGETAVSAHGGWAILPWRDQALAATARGLATASGAAGIADASQHQAVVHLHKSRSATAADVAEAWRCLAPGGRLLLCGDNQLGIASAIKRLAGELGQQPTLLANRGHGRIAAFVRGSGPSPAPPAAGTVPLDGSPGAPPLVAAPGVFSADALDPGTALLLACLAEQPPARRLLDLGCGIGHLAIAALRRWPAAEALLADGDARAVTCAAENLRRLGLAARATVRWWDAREPLPAGDWDLALVNPPCHRGVAVDLAPARAMFRALAAVLVRGGRALIVANRRLPYEADLAALGEVQLLAQQQGFKILEVVHE